MNKESYVGMKKYKRSKKNMLRDACKIVGDCITIVCGLMMGGFFVAIGFCWGLSLWGAWM